MGMRALQLPITHDAPSCSSLDCIERRTPWSTANEHPAQSGSYLFHVGVDAITVTCAMATVSIGRNRLDLRALPKAQLGQMPLAPRSEGLFFLRGVDSGESHLEDVRHAFDLASSGQRIAISDADDSARQECRDHPCAICEVRCGASSKEPQRGAGLHATDIDAGAGGSFALGL
jgi:hypothetical protein